MNPVSKSQLKNSLLEYLRKVEKGKQPLIVTHDGKPVIQISPYKQDQQEILKSLYNSVISYQDPTSPVGENDWEST